MATRGGAEHHLSERDEGTQRTIHPNQDVLERQCYPQLVRQSYANVLFAWSLSNILRPRGRALVEVSSSAICSPPRIGCVQPTVRPQLRRSQADALDCGQKAPQRREHRSPMRLRFITNMGLQMGNSPPHGGLWEFRGHDLGAQ